MSRFRNRLQLLIAAGLLIYTVPKLSLGEGWTTASVFAVSWLCIMLVIIAANLYFALGVRDNMQQSLRRMQLQRQKRVEQGVERLLSRRRMGG